MNGPSPDRLRDFAVEFDRWFGGYLTPKSDIPRELLEAIRYSALAPGKRIRPYLVVRCCELAGGSQEDAWPAAGPIVLAGSADSGYHSANDVGYDGSSAA
jgi:geranylgeranyl pyrophosphate synthase